ncbi:hypothetical protein D9M69_578930 [compost metagenome]
MPPTALRAWVAATATLAQGTSSAFVPRHTFHSASPMVRSRAQLISVDSALGSLRARSSNCATRRSPTSQEPSTITTTASETASATASRGDRRR